MTYEDDPLGGRDAYKARRYYTRRFNPGAYPAGDDWRAFLSHVAPGKAEADFAEDDWRKAYAAMRHYCADAPGVTADPSPFCVWYAETHGCRAE